MNKAFLLLHLAKFDVFHICAWQRHITVLTDSKHVGTRKENPISGTQSIILKQQISVNCFVISTEKKNLFYLFIMYNSSSKKEEKKDHLSVCSGGYLVN